MTDRRPTIYDVARVAGVSVGSVSNVLTNTKAVRADTRRRVERAVATLGYRPSRAAQSMRGRPSGMIGALVPEVTNPFFAELVQGIEEALGLAGYSVLFGTSHESAQAQRRYLDDFRERKVEGAIIVLAADTDGAELASMFEDVPIVAADRTVPAWHGDLVVGDSGIGMALAVEHLIGLGHRRIAMINGEMKLSTAAARERAFKRSLATAGIRPAHVSHGSFTLASGRAQTFRTLALADPPSAIVAGDDLLAMAAVEAIAEQGLRVPDDISVIGYDDIPYATLASPALTTVRQAPRAMGVAAARLLLERLAAPPPQPRYVTLTPELVVRASTGPCRSPAAGVDRRAQTQRKGTGREAAAAVKATR